MSDSDGLSPDRSPQEEDLPDPFAELAGGEEEEDMGDDLFGDGGDEDQDGIPAPRRTLDDEDLDSGDDERRNDRATMEGDDVEQQEEVQAVMDGRLGRHAVPEPSDNELYLMKVPRFLSIDPYSWHHTTFQPPSTDHHSKGPPSSTFSAFNTAMTTIHWRHSPSNPNELQSNARVLRWSDGSLTLQLASDPTTQYEIEGNPLAPRQHNPKKPTPTSTQDRGRRHVPTPSYNASQDSFTYLVAPHLNASLLRVTNKITTGLSILPSSDSADDALERLQSSLAAAASRGRESAADGGLALIEIGEDPENAKRRAEAAEKEKLKQQRSREKHEMREREQSSRVFGRSGAPSRAGGLTIGGLEDDEMGGAGAGAGRSGARGRAKPRRQRRDEYSDEEDFGRHKTYEDEYDEEDGFIVRSDEEDEVVEDDEEEEADFVDVRREERRARKADADESPKRMRNGDEGGADSAGAAAASAKRRRVVVEDDDDDE